MGDRPVARPLSHTPTPTGEHKHRKSETFMSRVGLEPTSPRSQCLSGRGYFVP
jgi:hypothetical protein